MYSMRTIFLRCTTLILLWKKNYINTRCKKNKPQKYVKLPLAITRTRTKVENLVHNSMSHSFEFDFEKKTKSLQLFMFSSAMVTWIFTMRNYILPVQCRLVQENINSRPTIERKFV